MQLFSFFKRTTKENERQRHLREFSCTFCAKARDDVRKLIQGYKAVICDECTLTASTFALLKDYSPAERSDLWELAEAHIPCDFCGKCVPEVWNILRRVNKGLICTECLELSNDIIVADHEERAGESEVCRYDHLSSQLKVQNKQHQNKQHKGGIFRRLRRRLTSRGF